MKASEAKRLSEEGGALDEQVLKEAYQVIETRAYVGLKTATIGYNTRTKPLKKKLEEDGYMVNLTRDQWEGDFYTVSW